MPRILHILLVASIVCAIISAGCITPSKSNPTTPAGGTNYLASDPSTSGVNTNTTVIPTTGSLLVTSSPYGADVYIEGRYAGNTTLQLDNVPVGIVNISLRLKGYSTVDGTTTVVAGKAAKFSGTLSKATANLEFIDVSVTGNGPCYFDYQGTLRNTGDANAQGVLLTLTLTPATYDQKNGYVPFTYTSTVGTVIGKTSQPFGFSGIHVPCGGAYSTTIDFKGVVTDPFVSTTTTAISGSTRL